MFGGGAANNPQTIPVTLTVSNDPLIVATFERLLDPNTTCPLSFPIQIGQNSPTTQTIRVTSSTGAQANFTATVRWIPLRLAARPGSPSGVTAARSRQ